MVIPWFRWTVLLAAPVLLSPLLFVFDDSAPRCAYVVLIMAVYWTLELLPLPVTSLLPVVLFPLLGIASTNDTAVVYMKGTNMMYLGSLMIALAVEESGLHRRVALKAMLLAGTSPTRIMLGFMLPTAFLSMWISNGATAAMMVPILEAVLAELGLSIKEKTMMMLAVAYSANIGGTGTIIGTPPNLILMEFMTQYTDHPLNFGSWMVFTIPSVLMNLLILWVVLQLYFMRPNPKQLFKKAKVDPESGVTKVIQESYDGLGAMTFHEIGVLGLFSTLVIIWFMRKPGFLPGWAEALQWTTASGSTVSIGSATPTILIVMLLFIIPANPAKDPSGPALLQWDAVQRKFPWGIILLMGGGFALAEGAKVSCLTHQIGAALEGLGHLPPVLILLVLCLVTSIISQIASNTATTSMLVPVVLAMAQSLHINPAYLALGVTLTASHAFMLPVSTPPNAIVFSAGGLAIKDMAGVGAILNILCISTTFLCLHTYAGVMFDLDTVPGWANVTVTKTNMCL
eukprot:GFUD01016459.1.p1 GENE.GFUD01016459.1~~GFUD01016459.1.p1  ORF type:complete len:521 (+),score=103.80 GFUD01016459.1:27-1565(+)